MISKFSIFLIIMLGVISCTHNSVQPVIKELDLVESIPIEIKEPSGITFNSSKTKLWIVGDKDPKIYLADLRGKIEKKISVSKNDMEGITSINDSLLAVVIENSREILFVDLKDKTEKIIETGLTGEKNNGFEGISYYSTENRLFIANEKKPKLILKFNFLGEIFTQKTISYCKDISDLYYDNDEDTLWVLSQESNMVYKCNTNFEIIAQFSVPDKRFEGIAVDGNTIYLVSDSEELLCIYNTPT